MIDPITAASLGSKAWGAIKSVPREVWYALVVLVAVWLIYREGVSDGRESVLAELRTAEAKAADKALEAIAEAGESGVERAERFEAEQQALGEAIEAAEAANGNSLDALF